MWGRQLVLGMGSDEGHETNAVNMLNMDTLTWESWDGNQQRVGGAMGLLEGKLFLVGGQAIYICIYTFFSYLNGSHNSLPYRTCCRFLLVSYRSQPEGFPNGLYS